tara:strand:- start:14 stop:529 length:516 start_codon:yes stop_codon:yes gene_type:complete
MSNLRLINETTVSSGVATVNIEDVFSADFDIYKISYTGTSASAVSVELRLINSSGSVITASNYNNAHLSMTSHTAFAESRGTNQAFMDNFFAINSNNDGSSVGYLFNPFSSSSYTFGIFQGDSHNTTPQLWSAKGISVLKQLSSCTGFQVFPNSANLNSAKIRTYGLRVDS